MIGRDMPETRRRKILIKNLDTSKIVVIFPHIYFSFQKTNKQQKNKNIKKQKKLKTKREHPRRID